MRVGGWRYFCNCLTKNGKDHVTVTDGDDNCLYCNYVAVYRKVTENDSKWQKLYGDEIEKRRKAVMEIFMKDIRYNDKVN